jgi:hypothetical protein
MDCEIVRDSGGEKERARKEGTEGHRRRQGWGRIYGKNRSKM